MVVNLGVVFAVTRGHGKIAGRILSVIVHTTRNIVSTSPRGSASGTKKFVDRFSSTTVRSVLAVVRWSSLKSIIPAEGATSTEGSYPEAAPGHICIVG
jgi:hypothetical protein